MLVTSFHQDCTASLPDRLSLNIPVRYLFFLHLVLSPGRFYLTVQLQGRRRKSWEPSQGWRSPTSFVPLPPPPPPSPKMREFFGVFCFQLQSMLCDTAPTVLCKNRTCWRAPTPFGDPCARQCTKTYKEWLCLRGFNFKKANGRIMEESRTETHSMVYPHSHWETDAA